jgi:hypothetical protein
MKGFQNRSATCLAAALLLLSGCGDSPSDPGDPDPPRATSVSISAPAETVASGASLQLTAVVQPPSAPQGVTWSSDDEAIATVNASGLVQALATGVVTIRATSTADPSLSDTRQIQVVCPEPRRVSANVGTDTTWENWIPDPACFDYVLTTSLNITAAVLTLQPGVVVGVEAGHRIRVASAGGLSAAGTAEHPIRLTGTVSARGHWVGVMLQNTSHPANALTHTIIEYAGSGSPATGSTLQPANLMLVENTVLQFDRVRLQESAAYGLYMHANVTLSGNGSRHTFTRNALGPAYTYASVVDQVVRFAGLNPDTVGFHGNDRDVLYLIPDAIRENVQWRRIGVPYRILQNNNREAFRIFAILDLHPGVIIEFEEDMAMYVAPGGALNASGTPTDSILLTGSEKVPGHWRGLAYVDSNNENFNTVEYVIIEYGGRASISIGEPANLVVTQNGSSSWLKLRHTTLRHSGGYGLYARFRTQLIDMQGMILTGNTLGPAHVSSTVVTHLLPGSWGGNAVDRVSVHTDATITTDATWRDLGVPYVILTQNSKESFRVDGATLTLEPGVDILLQDGMGLTIRQQGRLVAAGTAQNPISIRGDGVEWKGIDIFDSEADFEHLSVVGGGGWGFGAEPGSVTIRTGGSGPPASTARFGPQVSLSGARWAVVFSHGDTFGFNCPTPVYVPPSDDISQHCK